MNALDPAAYRGLRNIYAKIPDLHCKGLCASSCRTRIDMSQAERFRIEAVTGRRLPQELFEHVCPLLDEADQCGAYGVRPTLCRLWGAAESMPCPHGCVPDGGRLLTDDEMLELMLRSLEVGGARRGDDPARARKILHQLPEIRPLLARVLRGDYTAGAEMAALVRKRFPRGVPTDPS